MTRVLFVVFFVFLVGCSESVSEIHLEISDINIEKNENNGLSCFLSFSTDIETEIVVRYFSPAHKGYEIKGEKAVSHSFFLWGMRAETDYTIEIYSAQDLDKPVQTALFTAGSLPDSVPYMDLTVNESSKVAEGFLMFTYFTDPYELSKPIVMMLDTDGFVVWYFEYYMAGFNVIGDVSYIEDTRTVLMSLSKGPNMADIPAEEAIEIDLKGNVIWRSIELKSVHNGFNSWHHIYRRLPDDSLVMLKFNPVGNVITDYIINYDRDYNALWHWTYADHFEVPDCPTGDLCDWTHSNHVNMFKEKDITYVNSRNLSQYFKIDMESGNVLWTFGKDGDFEMISDHPDPWIEFAHAPEINYPEMNEILFYDNGSPERGYSRVIKYRIDETEMTAEIIFEFDGSEIDSKWFTSFWGSIQTVENGNIFVTAGSFGESEETKLFEITEKGEIVWSVSFDHPEPVGYINSIYNSFKFVPELNKIH